MARKKMDREERMEYKGGKYMGGPAEERAEKKKHTRRMDIGGPVTRTGRSIVTRPSYGNQMGKPPIMQNISNRKQDALDLKQKVGGAMQRISAARPPKIMSTPQTRDLTPGGYNKTMAPPQLGGGQFGANGGGTAPVQDFAQPVNATVTAPAQDFAQQADTTGMDKTAIGINKTMAPPQQADTPATTALQSMRKGGMVRGAGCAQRGMGRALSMHNSVKGRSKGKK